MNKKISIKFFQLFLIVAITALVGYWFGSTKVSATWKNYQPILSIQSKNPPPGENLDMSLFYTVLGRVDSMYYDKSKINAQKMVYGAIEGMVASLDDPFTSFFPPQQNTDFKSQLAGQFQGIGAELGTNDAKQVIIMAPLGGSPAEKAGLKSGDIILKVDGENTAGWSLDQAVSKIKGPKDTKVTLTVLHDKSKTPVDIPITRGVIQLDSVTSWVKNIDCSNNNNCAPKSNCPTCASVAYIRLSQFGDRTNTEWVKNVNSIVMELKKEQNFKGIILDLRNNPGGYLNDAVFIASEFIDSGTVVEEEDGQGNITKLDVNRQGLLTDKPLVVLINGGSASASEIVSGALHDHNRATLLGENSFGKGTIQQAVDLDGGASVHISVGKWLTPNGTWIDKKRTDGLPAGLTPDIKVAFDASKSAKMNFDNQLNAAIQHLVNQ